MAALGFEFQFNRGTAAAKATELRMPDEKRVYRD